MHDDAEEFWYYGLLIREARRDTTNHVPLQDRMEDSEQLSREEFRTALNELVRCGILTKNEARRIRRFIEANETYS